MVAPPNTPTALAAKINRDVVAVLQSEEVATKLREMRLDAMIGTPADATAFFKEETELWGNVIKEANVTIQ
jgi:tripartite-type tricarboxylate transporter receptor subunit TctC